MFLFNALVPCFPLDCSQIFVSVMLLCGATPDTAAKVMVFISVPVISALVLIALLSWSSGGPSAALSLFLAFWLAVQTLRLHKARQDGTLASFPLFRGPLATDASSAGASSSAQNSNASRLGSFFSFKRKFKPFQGEG